MNASQSAAAVVDLHEFRLRRSARRDETPAARRAAPPAMLAPFWVVWVPVWPVS